MKKQKNVNEGIAVLASFINQQNEIMTNFMKKVNFFKSSQLNGILEQVPITIQTLQLLPVQKKSNNEQSTKLGRQYDKSNKVQLQCKYCKRAYTSKMPLINHLKIVHSDNNEAKNIGLPNFYIRKLQSTKIKFVNINEFETDFKLLKSISLPEKQVKHKLLQNIISFEKRKKLSSPTDFQTQDFNDIE